MSLLPSQQTVSAADVVGIFNSSFRQVFTGARPINAKVLEDSRLMEHPVETGSTIVDHAVILPIEIEFALLLVGSDFRDVYQQLRQAWLAKDKFVIQTRTGTYPDMVLMSIPHDETSDMYDAIAMAVKFKEVKFVTPVFESLPAASVKNPADADTKQAGQKQGQPLTEGQNERRSSVLAGLFK